MRIYGSAYRLPDNNILYKDRTGSGAAGIARIIAEAQKGDNLHFELNAYQTSIPSSLVSMQTGLGTVLDVERSSLSEWSLSSRSYAHASVDRLNLRYTAGRLDIIAGRQPVNLSTTFFFSPNDFFAPFAAQAFYRLYKPGVDAVRAEIRLGDFSQLSLITVMGYGSDPAGKTGWSKMPADERSSHIFRISSVFGNFETGLLGGKVRKAKVFGGFLQGEILNYTGVRAEGNILYPDDDSKESRLAFSVGLDRHFANSLDLSMEYFYNSAGSDNASDYMENLMNMKNDLAYPGRSYLAAGAGYEFTPLFRGDMSVILNTDDSSALCSLYGVYSLSDETDVSVNMGIPIGKAPEGASLESEFGSYPCTITLEIRHFF